MQSNWWWKSTGAWDFRCELNTGRIRATDPEAYEVMRRQMNDIPDNLWDKQGTPCCGSKFFPWRSGASKVMEFTVNGEVQCILCERLPEKLDNEIKLLHLEWHRACGRLIPDQIQACIPHCVPKTNLCIKSKITGISRFDFKKWKAEGEPTLLKAGWIALCKLIAEEANSECFRDILSLCNDLTIANEADPDLKAAMTMSRARSLQQPDYGTARLQHPVYGPRQTGDLHRLPQRLRPDAVAAESHGASSSHQCLPVHASDASNPHQPSWAWCQCVPKADKQSVPLMVPPEPLLPYAPPPPPQPPLPSDPPPPRL